MSNVSMTAVEWLIDKITVKYTNGEIYNKFNDYVDLSEFINEAIEMEKNDIIDAHYFGQLEKEEDIEKAKDYYNDTY